MFRNICLEQKIQKQKLFCATLQNDVILFNVLRIFFTAFATHSETWNQYFMFNDRIVMILVDVMTLGSMKVLCVAEKGV